VSVPCGELGGLPVGLQLTGPSLEDGRVLGAAARFQEATDHHRRLSPFALEAV
jgi:aspartyl-tRNA(Asn)/glutamyl-tRNA(Gln) amidotransferase subunit A